MSILIGRRINPHNWKADVMSSIWNSLFLTGPYTVNEINRFLIYFTYTSTDLSLTSKMVTHNVIPIFYWLEWTKSVFLNKKIKWTTSVKKKKKQKPNSNSGETNLLINFSGAQLNSSGQFQSQVF